MDAEEENNTKFSVKNRLQMFEKNDETTTKPFVRRIPKEMSQEEYKGRPPLITKPVPKPLDVKAENFTSTTKLLHSEDKTAKFTDNSQNLSDKNTFSSKPQDVHLISKLNEEKVSPVQPPPRQYNVKSPPGRLPPKPHEFKLTSEVPSTKGSLSSSNDAKIQSVPIPTGQPLPTVLVQKMRERKLSFEPSGVEQTPVQQPLFQPPPVLPPPRLSELKSPPAEPLSMLSKQKVPLVLPSPPSCPPQKCSSEKVSLLETSNNLPNQIQTNFKQPPPAFAPPKLPELRLPPPVQPPPKLHEFKAPMVPPPPPLPSTSKLNEEKETFKNSSNNLSSHLQSTFIQPPPLFVTQQSYKTKLPPINPSPELNEFDTFEVPPPPLFSSQQLDEEKTILCESSNNASNQMQSTFNQPPPAFAPPKLPELRLLPPVQPPPKLHEFKAPMVPPPPPLPSTSKLNEEKETFQDSSNNLSSHIESTFIQPPPLFGPQKSYKTTFPPVNPPPELNELDTFEVPPPPLFSSQQLVEEKTLLCESSNNASNQMQSTFEQYPPVCDAPNSSELRQCPNEQPQNFDEFEVPRPSSFSSQKFDKRNELSSDSLTNSLNEIQSSINQPPLILPAPKLKEVQELPIQPPPIIDDLEESRMQPSSKIKEIEVPNIQSYIFDEVKDTKTQPEKHESEIIQFSKQVPRIPENITHPPLPPPPSKLAEVSTQGIANNLKEQSLSTGTAPNLPPPPSNKSSKKNILIGWVSNPKIENSSNQVVTQFISSSNITSKVMESNKTPAVVLPPPVTAPPIVVAPPSLESIKVAKDKDQTTSNVKVTNVQPKAQIENINEEQYDEDEDISNEPWFFNVSKEEATRLMKKSSKKGVYIIRPSENNQYVIMVRIENNEIKKFKIQKYNGGWILGDPNKTKKIHDSLTTLMKHYQKHGIKVGNVNIYLKEPLHKS